MMIFLSALAFFLCNLAIFWYARKVFTLISIKIPIFIAVLTVNMILYVTYVITADLPGVSLIRESVMSLIYVLVLFIEFKIVFKSNNSITFFGTCCFVICLSSIRMIVITIFSYIENTNVHLIVADYDTLVKIGITGYFAMAVYLIVLEKLLPMRIVILAVSYKESMIFAISSLSLVLLFLLMNRDSVYIESSSFEIARLNLQAGIVSICGFGLVLISASLFSNYQMNKQRSVIMEEEIKKKRAKIRNILENKDLDFGTNLLKRNAAEKKIRETIKSGKNFSLAFFDIDGLKFANDRYGHNEGDFYIKTVADTLENIFTINNVFRYGGDEFIAVIEDDDEYLVNQKVLISCKEVNKIKELYKKEYETSLSYGLVDIKAPCNYSMEEIIDIADKKMYIYKKKNKKERISINQNDRRKY